MTEPNACLQTESAVRNRGGVARPILPLLLLERRRDAGVVGFLVEFRTWQVLWGFEIPGRHWEICFIGVGDVRAVFDDGGSSWVRFSFSKTSFLHVVTKKSIITRPRHQVSDIL